MKKKKKEKNVNFDFDPTVVVLFSLEYLFPYTDIHY